MSCVNNYWNGRLVAQLESTHYFVSELDKILKQLHAPSNEVVTPTTKGRISLVQLGISHKQLERANEKCTVVC